MGQIRAQLRRLEGGVDPLCLALLPIEDVQARGVRDVIARREHLAVISPSQGGQLRPRPEQDRLLLNVVSFFARSPGARVSVLLLYTPIATHFTCAAFWGPRIAGS